MEKNAFPDGTHFGCNFLFEQTELDSAALCTLSVALSQTRPEEDADELPEGRLGVDTAGEGELIGLRRKLDTVGPIDRAISVRD